MNRKKLSIRLLSLIVLIFLVNFLAMKFYWYSLIWYFDMPMHFLGGFWVGLVLIWLFSKESIDFKFIFKILLGVLLIGFLWEIFEVLVDKTITENSFNILDTASDFCFDLVGGVVAIFYFLKRIMLKEENKI